MARVVICIRPALHPDSDLADAFQDDRAIALRPRSMPGPNYETF
jgi:hypothetical protein